MCVFQDTVKIDCACYVMILGASIFVFQENMIIY
jgi:hypothetical protein